MDGPVFDAMLKTALEEALLRDIEEAPEVPAPSRRQKRRMRRLLADSRGRGSFAPAAERRPRSPARWLAAVVIAALLTGAAAAGFALGNGERFRRMFEEDTWASDYYEGAADTEQLLDLGAGMDTALVESGGLRFEMLDAIFDGQRALAELRMTILDPALLEPLRESSAHFRDTDILLESGQDVMSWGYSAASWETEEDLEEGEYSLIFSINDESLNAGGRCVIRLRDLARFSESTEQEVLLPGEWTLAITLRPTELLRLEPGAVCRAGGVDWILDSVTLSPLALGLRFHREDGGRYSDWSPCRDLSVRLKNGEVLDLQGSRSEGRGDTQVDARIEFLIPLDLEQVESLHVCGVDVNLEK